jgi:hypothetical protein
LHLTLPWRLRRLDAGRVSLELRLPERPGLPRAQYLAKDGQVLLHWTEPSSARSLLDPESEVLQVLAALPAPAWQALLLGENLDRWIRSEREWRERGWRRLEGRLGPWPALLRHDGIRARSLRWESPEGALTLRWERLRAARRTFLRIRREGMPGLRIEFRPPRRRPLAESDWLFLGQSSIFGEPEAN